ncbi:hypothetical protein [Streptomyces sp. NBC_00102]|uniref:hypothetical protein n=1 Tax=Streptomyces sp. NBC_00102 TaxID=2975652 RepID=UPI0022561F8A|nr:hypothetical protein [Streptomyces sp. NBC_00102]MCX5399407.1 hypothetical protein [Streptomyces sp. NBC_00102]
MGGSGGEEDLSADREDAGPGRIGARQRPRAGWFLPLFRSWAAGALVFVALGFLADRTVDATLGTPERMESFAWRLGLLHVPGLAVAAFAVLAAARPLPERHRASRLLYPLGCLTAPTVVLGLGYGRGYGDGHRYGDAMPWNLDALGIEGVLMPVATLAAGAVLGVVVDRLLEERAAAPEPPYTYPYDWRSGGGRTGGHDWRARGER